MRFKTNPFKAEKVQPVKPAKKPEEKVAPPAPPRPLNTEESGRPLTKDKQHKRDIEQKLERVTNAAFHKAEVTLVAAVKRLRDIDARLFEIRDELKATQPKRNGAIILELKPCGKDCMGCPHIRWKQYKDPSKEGVKPGQRNPHRKESWNGYVIENPLKRIHKTGPFEAVYEKSRALMKEAEKLVEERSRLIGHFSNISRSLKASGHFDPNIKNPSEEG